MVAAAEKVRFIVRGAGKRLWTEWQEHREMLLVGAAGTAKSMSVAFWIDSMCRTYPGLRVLVFRKTRVSLTESWMQTFRKAMLDPHLYLLAEYGEHPPPELVTETQAYLARRGGYLFEGASDAHRKSYDYRNGSRIVLGGMDNPTKLFSTEYDVAYCNECNELTLGEWESIRRALRNRVLDWHPMIGDCNPDHPGHWLLARCKAGQTAEFKAPHTDNPWITSTPTGRQYLEDLSRQLTGVRRKRLLLGEWAGAEGQVYPEFDPDVHVIDGKLVRNENTGAWWLELPDRKVEIRRFVGGQDWGYANPGTLQIWGLDPEGRLYLLREWYHTGWRLDRWADIAEAQHKALRVNPIVCDSAVPESIDAYNDRLGSASDREAPRVAIKANKEIQAGLDHVRDRLELQEDGLPRIFFLRNALQHKPDPALTGEDVLASSQRPSCLVDEIPQYVNREVKDDDVDTRRDDPLKKNDHGCDAMRYVCSWAWRVNPGEAPPDQTFAPDSYGAMFKSHKRRRL